MHRAGTVARKVNHRLLWTVPGIYSHRPFSVRGCVSGRDTTDQAVEKRPCIRPAHAE